ncbi:uncharacterized protein LOC142224320 [Haematobia irritans]|uniref:uncharacterized protein LOC142224320 n=1 Tax=Haematobia irritans TaxID=7368 RepID=UPI003F4FFC6D
MNLLIKYLLISIFSCAIFKDVLGIECFSCNTRDDEGCENLKRSDNTTFVTTCEGVCAMVKGVWGNETNGEERKYAIRRFCGPIDYCTQNDALCCHCTHNYCNFGNVCFNRAGILEVPNIMVFCVLFLKLLCIVSNW